MSHKINVIILDRHQLVSEGLARILAAESDIEVIAAGNNQSEAITRAAANAPLVFILDANLAGVEDIARQLLTGHPIPRILILATDCQVQQALNLLGSGATGYLCKDADPQDFISAVRHTCRQEMVLDPAVAREVVVQLTHTHLPKTDFSDKFNELLTERELEVLQLLCQGISDKEIARHLCISIRTVNGHLRHIYAKLGVHSRTEAMHLAIEKGWVNLAIASVLLFAQFG